MCASNGMELQWSEKCTKFLPSKRMRLSTLCRAVANHVFLSKYTPDTLGALQCTGICCRNSQMAVSINLKLASWLLQIASWTASVQLLLIIAWLVYFCAAIDPDQFDLQCLWMFMIREASRDLQIAAIGSISKCLRMHASEMESLILICCSTSMRGSSACWSAIGLCICIYRTGANFSQPSLAWSPAKGLPNLGSPVELPQCILEDDQETCWRTQLTSNVKLKRFLW